MFQLTRTFKTFCVVVQKQCNVNSVFTKQQKCNLPISGIISNSIRKCSNIPNSKQDEEEDEIHEINYAALTNGDPELEHKLKVIELETEVMRQEGKPIPSNSFMKDNHWAELLKLPTRTGRRKYLEYLFKISKKKENRSLKKEQKRTERTDTKPVNEKCDSVEEFALKYGLIYNNMFLRFYDSTINQMYNNKLIQAMQFGEKLIVDCGYDSNMTKRESVNAAKQLMLLFAENRMHDDPFDLHFCNIDKSGTLMTYLHKHIPTMYETHFPLNLHECSYLDVFPKDQLIYLTPHCHEEVKEYDHDSIYIIGGIVDKVNNEPLSMAKAKREGIRMAKLPLDRYLQWGCGSGKSLTLNQMVAILLDVKMDGNWSNALRHVPKRKIVDFSIGSNLNRSELRYDREKSVRGTKWRPTEGTFGKLNYNNRKDDKNNVSSRVRDIRSIFNE